MQYSASLPSASRPSWRCARSARRCPSRDQQQLHLNAGVALEGLGRHVDALRIYAHALNVVPVAEHPALLANYVTTLQMISGTHFSYGRPVFAGPARA